MLVQTLKKKWIQLLHPRLQKKSYKLPDGQIITIGNNQFRCPEILFQPSFIGLESPGIHENVYNRIIKCDVNLIKDLFTNICVIGLYFNVTEYVDCLRNELTDLAPSKLKIKFIDLPERKYSAWIGGSICASIPAFMPFWINKQEYVDYD